MRLPPDVDPLSQVQWEDEEDAALYGQMVDEARSFLGSFRWCAGVRQMFAGLAVPGVVAVFFAEIVPAKANVDEALWVVVGDLPPAYLADEGSADSAEALRRYIAEMRRWVQAARVGEPVDDLIPVNVGPTRESAARLASRLDFLELEVLRP
jgi:hypothetical protein